MTHIDRRVMDDALTYDAYLALIHQLLSQNKTTGTDQSPTMIQYTELNQVRMARLDKTTKLSEALTSKLAQFTRKEIWLVLTEGWCGDAAQVIPVLAKIADNSPYIDLRLILRDEHLDIMDAFLTDGARSIPKLLVLDAETLEVLRTWGPRPSAPQQMVLEAKAKMREMSDHAEQKAFFDAVKTEVQKWYARDKTRGIQEEIGEFVSTND
ncbi:MAG TPA: thioredoxin family protein [Saprospiraceae bacterium]|nr:thioredoxin family protein [Saprospiraceae bacterium]HMQ83694.1 thioredoxin family protein [Saprospiraceae bacterium]